MRKFDFGEEYQTRLVADAKAAYEARMQARQFTSSWATQQLVSVGYTSYISTVQHAGNYFYIAPACQINAPGAPGVINHG